MDKNRRAPPPMTVTEMAAMGGNARRDKLTKTRRREIAKHAAKTRWAGKNVTKKTE
jgi:hypothetical protein